jgi:PPOX class probable F420-dependent enzyme
VAVERDMIIEPHFRNIIERAKVARLATIGSGLIPHAVPVVFVFDGKRFYIPIDEKKKKVRPEELGRVKNIRSNPNVCLLIDEYDDEDWSKLCFVMIRGKASVESRKQQHNNDDDDDESTSLQRAYENLVRKYPQYQSVGLSNLCIVISPEKIVSWSNIF